VDSQRRGGLGVKTPRTEYYIVVKLYWYVETWQATLPICFKDREGYFAPRPMTLEKKYRDNFYISEQLVVGRVRQGVLSNCPKCPSAIPAAQTRQPPTPRFANLASVFGNTQMQRFSFLILITPQKRRRTPKFESVVKHDGRTVTARGNAAPWAPSATVPRYAISASAVRCTWLRLQGR
jgi:hypothetical protein